MSTGCEFYADALVDLAAGSLEEGRAERVKAHLESCEDCRAALAVIREVRRSPAPVPHDLEARIRAAVRGGSSAPAPIRRPAPWRGWRPWALPALAAAALALWVGGTAILSGGSAGDGQVTEVAVEYDPYGAWPASDGMVAGDLVLSELTVDELEALLEEMQ
jgi:anti-sigma factor RsiW